MTREEREQALEWFKNRPITMSGAKKMYGLAISALEQPEPCEDTISRQAAIDALDKEYRCTDQSDDWDSLKTAMLIIENLPSAQPDTDKWCTDCKEYDQEHHCCPRWNRVIKTTLMDAQQWIPVSELPSRRSSGNDGTLCHY